MTEQDLDLEAKSNDEVTHTELSDTTLNGTENIESTDSPPSVDNSSNLSLHRVDQASSVVETKLAINDKQSTFAQIVKGWETYVSASNEMGPFQPLQQPMQMFQGFRFRGQSSHDPPPLPSSAFPNFSPIYYTSLDAPALRHTHSTPNQFTPPMVNFEEACQVSQPRNEVLPPAVPLDPFQRSSSTPSAYRKIQDQTTSFVKSDSSAFSLAPQRMSYTGQLYSNPYSAFTPVKYYELALEDMERTSIEVTDTTMRLENDNQGLNVVDESNEMKDSKLDSVFESSASAFTGKRGPAFRAARFLSDVRVLRRKRRFRTGRENPFQPVDDTAINSNDDTPIAPTVPLKLEAAVTIVTDPDWQNISAPVATGSYVANKDVTSSFDSIAQNNTNVNDNDEDKNDKFDDRGHFRRLDSDIDEEDDLFRRIDAQLHVGSPCTIPPPSYQNFVDKHTFGTLEEAENNAMSPPSIQFLETQSIGAALQVTFDTVAARSPSPTRMDYCDDANLSPRSQESFSISPGTTRSAGTGSSSGQTTHATSNSSTGQQSGLSTISETDREVMETNKEAKRRRGLDGNRSTLKSDHDATSFNSSSTQSTNPHGYISLGESPITLREGANVPVERFFSNTPSLYADQLSHINPFLTTTMSNGARLREGIASPSVTSETVSATNTSSSTYSEGEPPIFVSYIDSTNATDLGRYQDSSEIQSERNVDGDAREPSPAPSEVTGTSNYDIFDEPKVARELRVRRLRKYRTRSMRSPRFASSLLIKTPPPPQTLVRSSSPMIHQPISPPQKLVDHPVSSISRPNFIRSGAVTTFPNLQYDTAEAQQFPTTVSGITEASASLPQTMDLTSGQDLSRSATYNERNIEIVQSDSIDEAVVKIITPEKED